MDAWHRTVETVTTAKINPSLVVLEERNSVALKENATEQMTIVVCHHLLYHYMYLLQYPWFALKIKVLILFAMNDLKLFNIYLLDESSKRDTDLSVMKCKGFVINLEEVRRVCMDNWLNDIVGSIVSYQCLFYLLHVNIAC